MKVYNRKKIKEYCFKDLSNEEVKNIANKDLPINVKKLGYLIHNIHQKYPLIEEGEISIIVKQFFQSLRDFLILGYVINFNNFIYDMKLHFFDRYRKGKYDHGVKVSVKTTKDLKKTNDK